MITMSNIKKGLVDALDAAYPAIAIYPEAVKQDMERPCFFVNIIPISANPENSFQRTKAMLGNIVYFPKDPVKNDDTNEELYGKIDELPDKIPTVLQVTSEDNILLKDMEFQIVEQKLQCTFNISFIHNMEIPVGEIGEDRELMQELNLTRS